MVACEAALQRTEHRHCTHTKQESSRHQSFPNAGTAISGNPCADVFAKAVEPLLQAKQLAKARAERERKNGDDGAVPIKVSFYAGADQHEPDGRHDSFGYTLRKSLFCKKADQPACDNRGAVYKCCNHFRKHLSNQTNRS